MFQTRNNSDEFQYDQLDSCINFQKMVMNEANLFTQQSSRQLQDLKVHVASLANAINALELQRCEIQFHPRPLFPVQNRSPQMMFVPETSAPFYPVDFQQYHFETSPSIPFATRDDHNEISPHNPFVFTLMNSSNDFKKVEQPSNDDDESEPNDDETDSSFPAIVHLPLVEVKTGEEDEEILFCERAKLYRFDSTSNQMKERGVGPMKILQHRTTGICRILMRRDEIFKICANHRISPEIKLDKHQGKDTTFIWSAVDFSDGKENGEVFCVRFKTAEQAQAFHEQFNRAQKINRDQLNVSKSDDEDLIFLHEIRPTDEQIDRAARLQLPLSFYLYENRPPCPGCRGCDKNSSISLLNGVRNDNSMSFMNRPMVPNDVGNLSPLQFISSISQMNINDATLAALLSQLQSDRMNMTPTYHPPFPPSINRTQRQIVKAKRTLPTNRPAPPSISPPLPTGTTSKNDEVSIVQAHQKKSRNLISETTPSFSLDEFASTMTKTIIDLAKKTLHQRFSDPSADESGFSFTNFQMTIDNSAKSFEFFGSPCAEKFIFGSTSSSKSSPEENSPNETDDEISFCEKIELFRFDSKEKLGNALLKIIQEKPTNISRILICCETTGKYWIDQPITATIDVKAFDDDQTKFKFSTGNKNDEEFILKFENVDQMKRFSEQFDCAKINTALAQDN